MKQKYKDILTGALIPIIAYGVYCYGKAFKDGSDDVGRMRDFMQNSPRIEYPIKEGESLRALREKLFPIKEDEFKGLDSKIFYNREWGYKSLAADNIWFQTIRKESHTPWYYPYSFSFVPLKDGKISVPARETCQTIK